MKPDFSSSEDLASAAAHPRPAPVGGILFWLLPTAMALYGNFQGVQQILVPAQVEALDPATKVANIAILTVICAVAGVVGVMAGGAASDATRSRWGARAPWLVAMAGASSALCVALGFQHSVIGVAVFYGALWVSLNFFQGVLLSVAPNRIPDHRRSVASSILGVAGPLGTLLGVNVAVLSPSGWSYAALAAIHVATTAAFVVFAPEAPSPARAPSRKTPDPNRLRAALRALGSFTSRDFSLAYAFRVLMFIGQFSVNNYLLYIIQDHIGVARIPGHDARLAAGDFNTLRTTATIVAIAVGLWFANRTERRKLFAQIYVVGMSAAMIVPVFMPTWPGMVIFGLLGGLSMGVYSTIDLTLMSRVLPNKLTAGRDLAFLVMAGAAAQFVAPPLGGAVIRLLGYDALFLVAAAITLLAGAVTFFFRGVR